MMIANQVLSAELFQATKWTTLYWWNLKKYESGKVELKLDNKKVNAASIPAYNFDFLFEKLRPVILLQPEDKKLETFNILLKSPNPADALCRLAIILGKEGLLK